MNIFSGLIEPTLKWIEANREWFLSGLGITLISFICTFFYKVVQYQKSKIQKNTKIIVRKFSKKTTPVYRTKGINDYFNENNEREFALKLDITISAVSEDIVLHKIRLYNRNISTLKRKMELHQLERIKNFLEVKSFYEYCEESLDTYRISKWLDMILPNVKKFKVAGYRLSKNLSESLTIFIVFGDYCYPDYSEESKIEILKILNLDGWFLDIEYDNFKKRIYIR